MVFGWGKKEKKAKVEEQIPQKEKEVSLSKINKVTEEVKSNHLKTIVSQAKVLRDQVEPRRVALLEIAEHLEKDDLNVDDVDQHLKMLVLRGKKLVITTIKSEASVKFSQVKSYEDANDLNVTLAQMLKKIGIVLGQQSRVIHIFAKKYAGKLKDHLAVMKNDREELQTLINNYSTLDNNISEIANMKSRYEEMNKEISHMKDRKDELTTSIEENEKKIKSITEQITKLQNTKEYSQYLQIKEKIQALSSEQEQIKNQIDIQFTKISRPLSKYEHVSSLDVPQKKLLFKLNQNPFEAVTEENKENLILILEAVRKAVESGSVSVKDTSKSLSQINETIIFFDEYIEKRSKFSDKKSKLEEELKVFDIGKLSKKESELLKTKEDIDDSKSRIEKLDLEISDTNKKIPHLIMDMESKLRSISATRYRIKI